MAHLRGIAHCLRRLPHLQKRSAIYGDTVRIGLNSGVSASTAAFHPARVSNTQFELSPLKRANYFGGRAADCTGLDFGASTMPRNVRLFERLWYVSLGIGLLILAIDFRSLTSLATPVYVAVVQIVSFALVVFLVWLIARRRVGWLRWLLLLLFLAGLPFAVQNIAAIFLRATAVGVLLCLQAGLQVVGLYLIFTGDAKPWFRNGVGEI